jgi:hypothetical protein
MTRVVQLAPTGAFVLTSVPAAELPPAFTGALVLINDPWPELSDEPDPEPDPAFTGALVLISDPLPELSDEPDPEPDPAFTGALVLINDPWPDPEAAVEPLPPAFTGTLVLTNDPLAPVGMVPVGTVPVGTEPVGTVPVGMVPVGTGVAVPPALEVAPGAEVVSPEAVEPELAAVVPVVPVVPAVPDPFRAAAERPPWQAERPWADAVLDEVAAAMRPREEAPRAATMTAAARLLNFNMRKSPIRLVCRSGGVHLRDEIGQETTNREG